METLHLVHGFEPVYDANSRVLVLGTFPSVASRQNGFYYGHPRNRFWAVIAAAFGCEVPVTIPEKQRLLLSHGIALWDVAHECDVTGSADSSIKKVAANDVSIILSSCEICRILANGQTAARLYNRLCLPATRREILALPSTSPANAAMSLDALIAAWSAQLISLP